VAKFEGFYGVLPLRGSMTSCTKHVLSFARGRYCNRNLKEGKLCGRGSFRRRVEQISKKIWILKRRVQKGLFLVSLWFCNA